ncbi:MarR family transcriptional regulator [Blastococcus sp. TF02-8]|uniref:MarR family winged helix-turn-helix transcriptional regulator n=1 Tax=Blastococcus sp. TF02-8 TaxID=2250574 RepID=UPI000DEB0482|nr:MarR family transcriptional regulator [Blastococcus sp. TF02-8]RBY97130.1 MarR family transcriptional regulator [Blastococcus sp. TF02-8]
MTTSAAPGPPPDRSADLRALADELPRFFRLVQAARTRLSSPTRDRAGLLLLHPLARLGPLRQGALAELVHADPSTISRHVAALVEAGLVRRAADASDGRASRLVITDDGLATLVALRDEREAHLTAVTAAWSDDDVGTFTTLLRRFLDDLAAALPGWPGTASVPSTSTSATSPRENR